MQLTRNLEFNLGSKSGEKMEKEKEIFDSCSTVAIVGLSVNEERPSNHVGNYLKEKGYKIIPVNPYATEILGEKCFPDLKSIPEKVDIVDIFRRSDSVIPLVDEAIQIGARVVWMQEGVVNAEAAAKAEKAGLRVVMDKCMLKEHMRLFGF
jgi:predicted CoA-binding protein